MIPLKIDILGIDRSGCMLNLYLQQSVHGWVRRLLPFGLSCRDHVFNWLHTDQTENRQSWVLVIFYILLGQKLHQLKAVYPLPDSAFLRNPMLPLKSMLIVSIYRSQACSSHVRSHSLWQAFHILSQLAKSFHHTICSFPSNVPGYGMEWMLCSQKCRENSNAGENHLCCRIIKTHQGEKETYKGPPHQRTCASVPQHSQATSPLRQAHSSVLPSQQQSHFAPL